MYTESYGHEFLSVDMKWTTIRNSKRFSRCKNTVCDNGRTKQIRCQVAATLTFMISLQNTVITSIIINYSRVEIKEIDLLLFSSVFVLLRILIY